MAQKAHSLSHTKWHCKYHIVFTPKYRRKVIYNQYRSSLAKYFIACVVIKELKLSRVT